MPAKQSRRPSKANGSILPIGEEVAAAMAALKRLGSKRAREEMGTRYGITGKTAESALGVSMSSMKALAVRLTISGNPERNHRLAAALWETGSYDARMVASMVDDAALVTPRQMDQWCRGFDNWAVCDTVCFKLFDRVEPELAFRKVDQWAKGVKGSSNGHDEFVRRGAFALLACVALHDKGLADQPFLDRLPLIEKAATDGRNFVRKGVSWALRSMGRRGPSLRTAARVVAQRLANSEDSSQRWVGKDALKDLK